MAALSKRKTAARLARAPPAGTLHQRRRGKPVQGLDLGRWRRRHRGFGVGDDLDEMPIAPLGDIDRDRLGVVARNVGAREFGEQAVEGAMGAVGRGAIERLLPEGLERLQAGMLAGEPVAKFAHTCFLPRPREKAVMSSRREPALQTIFETSI